MFVLRKLELAAPCQAEMYWNRLDEWSHLTCRISSGLSKLHSTGVDGTWYMDKNKGTQMLDTLEVVAYTGVWEACHVLCLNPTQEDAWQPGIE